MGVQARSQRPRAPRTPPTPSTHASPAGADPPRPRVQRGARLLIAVVSVLAASALALQGLMRRGEVGVLRAARTATDRLSKPESRSNSAATIAGGVTSSNPFEDEALRKIDEEIKAIETTIGEQLSGGDASWRRAIADSEAAEREFREANEALTDVVTTPVAAAAKDLVKGNFDPVLPKRYFSELVALMTDLLFALDTFGIVYFQSGGTFIGIVRHQGMIPWDDDVDLYVERTWEQFKTMQKKVPVGNFFCSLYGM